MKNWRRHAMVLLTTLLASAMPAAAAGPTLLLYGDSLLAGYGLPPDQGFARQLQAAMDAAGLEATLVNASVSGETTAAGRARLERSLTSAPDAVILGLGANDMLQGLSPTTARQNLAAMLDRFDAMDLPVLLLGMLADRRRGSDYVEAFDGLYPALARQYDTLLYPFFLDGVALDPAFNQADGHHPNAAGVARIVDRVLPYVAQLLQRLPRQ